MNGNNCIYMDTILKDNRLFYEFYWRKFRIIRIEYSRNGEIVTKMPGISHYVNILLEMNALKKIYVRKKLTVAEMREVVRIFPFIYEYRGLHDFRNHFYKYNKGYPYKEDDEGNRLKISILNRISTDYTWHIEFGDQDTMFLVKEWKSDNGKRNIIVMNDDIICSNLSLEEIKRAEINQNFSCVLDVEKNTVMTFFSCTCPELQVKAYLNSGGQNIIHLCRARMDGNIVFELLAKSGLGKLADAFLRDEFEKLSIDETRPDKVFGLPMKLLMKLNSVYESISIATEQERIGMLEAWNRFPELFDAPLREIDVMWINFYMVSKNNELFRTELIEQLPLKQTIIYLRRQIESSGLNDFCIFTYYENYVVTCHKIGEGFLFGKYPPDLEKALLKMIELIKNIKKTHMENMFKEAVNSDDYQIYMDDCVTEEYYVKSPDDNQQLFLAGEELRNCLASYVTKIKNKKCIIGLVYHRTGRNTDKLIGAIEIIDNMIVQAKSHANQSFKGASKDFLNRYAIRKGLTSNSIQVI